MLVRHMVRRMSSEAKITVARLEEIYHDTKNSCKQRTGLARIDPRAVFANNELDLSKIEGYGFDYDYTLAVYTRELNELIYRLATERLVTQFKYPEEILDVPYDMSFAIRGLHYDIPNSCLLKVDAFSSIQKGTVYRGIKQMSDEQVKKIYPAFSVPDLKGRDLPQLIDFFSLPWAGLLSTVVYYCDTNKIVFDPKCLYDDVAASVSQVHATGQMYQQVGEQMEKYVHRNEGLLGYLEFLTQHKKELFVVTNSPYTFINVGLSYMLGKDWRRFFDYVVVSAKKPTFFHRQEPFRIYDEKTDAVSFQKIGHLEKGRIYSGGNIGELSEGASYHDKGVLYFGDHIYTDLADPMLRLGWRTAAIVPELAREIRTQNDSGYRNIIQWMETLTLLIEKYQKWGNACPEAGQLIEEWRKERRDIREHIKAMFNPQFGSLFRTYNNMTYFSRRLNRLSDIYTSRVPNLQKYSIDHCFFPRRNALPHEPVHPNPTVTEDH